MKPRMILLTRLDQIERQMEELKQDIVTHFPHGEDTNCPNTLFFARSYPGGIIQTVEQDLYRLKTRVKEALPT